MAAEGVAAWLRRHWIWATVVGCAALLVIGCAISIRQARTDWDDIESAAATFPAPPGFDRLRVLRQGDGVRCSFDPGCATPLLAVTYRSVRGHAFSCDDLEAAVTSWGEAALEKATRGACLYEGTLDGHFASVDLFQRSRGDEIRLTINAADVS